MTESSPWYLRPLKNDDLPARIEVEGDVLTLGRDPSNDVALSHERFPHVSGHHARIDRRGDSLFLEDLDSKNGTYVNGRRVDKAEIAKGDTIQLGEHGPRFLILSGKELEETVSFESSVDPSPQSQGPQSEVFSKTAIVKMRRALGIPEEKGVGEVLADRSRKHRTANFVIVTVVILLVLAAVIYLREENRKELAKLQALSDRIQSDFATRLEEASSRLDLQALEYEQQKQGAEQTRDSLQSRLIRLESEGASSLEELNVLRRELEDANEQLRRYNPIEIEKSTLLDVKKVRDAVALIEVRLIYRRGGDGKRLYYTQNEQGRRTFNLEEEGIPFDERLSNGSGFCVSPDGYFLTNAHVLLPNLEYFPPILDLDCYPEVQFDVVFSGTTKRHPGTKIKAILNDEEDVGLLKIAPFEGMPHLSGFSTDREEAVQGMEVYLCGFPLGRNVIHREDELTASTFKGILSRVSRPYYQVDAGVHPGNSGGPLIDRQGNVIGIVTAVQNTPKGSAPHIGYVLPIRAVSSVWPPPTP